jgi:phospholipid transport system substrate-binding protein
VQLTALTTTSFQQQISQRLLVAVMLLFVATVVWVVPSLSAAEPSTHPVESAATEAVRSTVSELIQILDDPRLKEPERTEQRRHEIERIVMRRVSYEEMAKRALGASWSDITEHERQEFVGLFVQLLRDAFAGRITEHTDEQVVYLGEQREDHFAEVKTQLKGQKVDTHVDFRLLHASGDWLVYDVVIDGASIVSNYRAQFATIIRDVTYVGLVKKMKQNAIAVKFFEKTTPH